MNNGFEEWITKEINLLVRHARLFFSYVVYSKMSNVSNCPTPFEPLTYKMVYYIAMNLTNGQIRFKNINSFENLM